MQSFFPLDIERLLLLTIQQAEHFLHHGSIIYKIQINGRYFYDVSLSHGEIILGLIGKHCKNIGEM